MTRKQELLNYIKNHKRRIKRAEKSKYKDLIFEDYNRCLKNAKNELIVMELDKRIKELNNIINDNRGCKTIKGIIEELKQIKKEALK